MHPLTVLTLQKLLSKSFSGVPKLPKLLVDYRAIVCICMYIRMILFSVIQFLRLVGIAIGQNQLECFKAKT